ncbi:MAG: hypothetical protein AYP45_17030 [Candidatus Brocadia carolinensis]|uniref:DUF7948 domain-containing protein n=1 Tax=Candidatus Brocadia carolinensis TaxID=1004156 RepID=A0A1V4APJ9_9BACT|nr:MAG: hypothetical protein AYP45_17030 [Candidatus Brocadia caroliniensis]
MSIKISAFFISQIILYLAFGGLPLLVVQAGENKPLHKDFIQKAEQLHLPFITNAGQTHEKVKYHADTFVGKVFITKDGEIVYSMLPKSRKKEPRVLGQESVTRETAFGQRVLDGNMLLRAGIPDTSLISYHDTIFKMVAPSSKCTIPPPTSNHLESPLRGLALKEVFAGGNIDTVQGEGEVVTQVNYFKGNDPAQWKRNVPAYEVVNLGEVYKGIQIRLRAYGNNIEKRFYLKPHADPEVITMKLSGAHAISVDSTGQLEVTTDLGTVKFTKPKAYQEINGKRVEVPVDYEIQHLGDVDQNTETNLSCQKSKSRNPKYEVENVYGFKVASYDKTKELVIDPLLASTYLGGVESDYGNSIAIDADQNIYVAGYTRSPNFPTTAGAFDVSYNADDIFVSKLNADLTQLLASTFLGGASEDFVRSIALDKAKNVYLAGQTSSPDFPTTDDAYDTIKNGYCDAFLAKFSGDLTDLLASTYLGGSSDDSANAITFGPSGIILCVTGRTLSPDFPTTPGVYDTGFKNGDVFIARLDWNLGHIISSTYLGGTSNDYGNAIAVDAQRNIYVAGDTWSFDFPVSINAYSISFGGGFGDAFITKLNWDLTRVLASTYLGGVTDDFATAIALDAQNHIYVVGQTESLDFPTTPFAYDTDFHNGDAFVSKFNVDLTKLLASTFLGGADDDVANSVALGPDGNVYVGGYTGSSDFPITAGAYSISKGVLFDAFLTKLDERLTRILASTFLGGNYRDIARSFVIDRKGNIYTTGETRSSNFPVTPNAYDTSYNSDARLSISYDAFVSKLNSNLSSPLVKTK